MHKASLDMHIVMFTVIWQSFYVIFMFHHDLHMDHFRGLAPFETLGVAASMQNRKSFAHKHKFP